MLEITQEDIDNGCIILDSPFAKEISFTSDKFKGYLYRIDQTVYLSFIISVEPGKGNVRNLIQTIKDKGYNIKAIPSSARMLNICLSMGFVDNGECMMFEQKES